MAWLLELVFGPSIPENPHYEVIRDITRIIPWWYLHAVAACALLFVLLLWTRYRRAGNPQAVVRWRTSPHGAPSRQAVPVKADALAPGLDRTMHPGSL